MVVADLHVHTTNSDGALSLSGVVEAAAAADLAAVAVTDHDRLHPDLSDPVAVRSGVAVVHGIELRVETDRQRVDLLGYGVRPTDALRAECERLQADRMDRGRRIVAAVEDRLGVDLDVAIEPGLGRPDVARAIDAHPDVDYDYQGAFDELIGDDGPCYVPRDVPSAARGRELLADACDLVGLAHPLRYEDPPAALELAATLDAVERYYPYETPVDAAPVDRAIEGQDLLATGGSDAHDDGVGRAGLAATDYEPVREALGIPP